MKGIDRSSIEEIDRITTRSGVGEISDPNLGYFWSNRIISSVLGVLGVPRSVEQSAVERRQDPIVLVCKRLFSPLNPPLIDQSDTFLKHAIRRQIAHTALFLNFDWRVHLGDRFSVG